MALNPQNLVKNEDRTPEERRRNARKAGKASAEARRRKRDMRETFRDLLDMPLKEGDLDEVTALAGANRKNVTVGEAIALIMANKAIKGDVKAAEFVRDTSGQRPTSSVQVTAESKEASAAFMALVEGIKADG